MTNAERWWLLQDKTERNVLENNWKCIELHECVTTNEFMCIYGVRWTPQTDLLICVCNTRAIHVDGFLSLFVLIVDLLGIGYFLCHFNFINSAITAKHFKPFILWTSTTWKIAHMWALGCIHITQYQNSYQRKLITRFGHMFCLRTKQKWKKKKNWFLSLEAHMKPNVEHRTVFDTKTGIRGRFIPWWDMGWATTIIWQTKMKTVCPSTN